MPISIIHNQCCFNDNFLPGSEAPYPKGRGLKGSLPVNDHPQTGCVAIRHPPPNASGSSTGQVPRSGREPGSSNCMLILVNSGFRISSRKAGFVRNDGFCELRHGLRAGGLNFPAKSGERQKHLSAFNGALATGYSGKKSGIACKYTVQHLPYVI
jgi:hypothetical protein